MIDMGEHSMQREFHDQNTWLSVLYLHKVQCGVSGVCSRVCMVCVCVLVCVVCVCVCVCVCARVVYVLTSQGVLSEEKQYRRKDCKTRSNSP